MYDDVLRPERERDQLEKLDPEEMAESFRKKKDQPIKPDDNDALRSDSLLGKLTDAAAIRLLLIQAIERLPNEAFASREAFESSLRDEVNELVNHPRRVVAGRPAFSFEYLSGKLSKNTRSVVVYGVEVKPGGINVYAIAGILSTAMAGCMATPECRGDVKKILISALEGDPEIQREIDIH